MKQVTDSSALEKIVELIISENPEQVEKLSENRKLLGWFVGQAMKKTGGRGNPRVINDLIAKKLNL